jgi:hypothetical protein
MADDIEVTVDPAGIALVTLNRPHKRNAVSLAMWRELAEVYADFAGRGDVRVAILTGAGGHFCGGADIAEFATVRNNVEDARIYGRPAEPQPTRSSGCHSPPSPQYTAMEWAAVVDSRWHAICAWATPQHRWESPRHDYPWSMAYWTAACCCAQSGSQMPSWCSTRDATFP